MGRFVAGDIVVIPFPFDDLSASKQRPALILSESWPNAYLVAAITSQEKRIAQGAVEITSADLAEGILRRTSFIRLDVCFTAHESLLVRKIGRLHPGFHHTMIDKICRLFREHAPKNA